MHVNSKRIKHQLIRPRLGTLLLLPWLLACTESNTEPTSADFSPAANVLNNKKVIADTAEIDAFLESDSQARAFAEKVFTTNTELVAKAVPKTRLPAPDSEQPLKERKAYFGDLHVHTDYSFDAYAFGTMATPYDAYRFAKGEAIENAAGFDMQLSRPMDFYGVTDHAMFLGVAKAAADTSTAFSKNAFSQPFHNLNAPENSGTDPLSALKRIVTFATFLPDAVQSIGNGELDRAQVLGIIRSAWADTIAAADQFNDPGRFTTFVAYEYTTSSADMGNLHRNVIFADSKRLPLEPFSRFHSVNPEDLWQWMDELRAKGVESLAIPHNSNGSNGQMFKLVDWAGKPMDEAYTQQRIRNEPLVEITQIKGTSETHPVLSSRDEWAGFEIMPYRVATGALSQPQGSYVREALLNGLALEQQGITNPYQFGLIGSSDTHSAASQNDESNYASKLGLMSGKDAQRGSVPLAPLIGAITYYGAKIGSAVVSTPMGKHSYIKIDGDVYANGSGQPLFGASGLAAVWAEENTRDSIYSAFRRKETFATSGPQIKLRFFAGYGLDDSMLTAADGVARAYRQGVSMGGSIYPQSKTVSDQGSPAFLVMASADPQSAPLQRLQIIKGWVDADGQTHEKVIDVACAGGADVNTATNRCPDNGARVDIADCSINPETGATQLAALWFDPAFQSQQRAFYYARALENPTCRWSTWDANRAGVAPRADLVKTIQERAWSSPIHYLAGAAQ